MNGISILKNDHAVVRNLFKDLKTSNDSTFRRSTLNTMVKELSQHAAVEEQVLYPTIRQLSSFGASEADSSIKAHQAIKELLDKLDKMGPSAPEFDQTMSILVQDFNEHTNEEETAVFPHLEQHLSQQDLEDLGVIVNSLKSASPTHPHPGMPATPPGNLILGPLTAFLDKIRDLGRTFKPVEQSPSTQQTS